MGIDQHRVEQTRLHQPGVDCLAVDSGETVAELRQPDEPHSETGQYERHPAVPGFADGGGDKGVGNQDQKHDGEPAEEPVNQVETPSRRSGQAAQDQVNEVEKSRAIRLRREVVREQDLPFGGLSHQSQVDIVVVDGVPTDQSHELLGRKCLSVSDPIRRPGDEQKHHRDQEWKYPFIVPHPAIRPGRGRGRSGQACRLPRHRNASAQTFPISLRSSRNAPAMA